MFKRIANFGTVTAENSNFKATSNKMERFSFYSVNMYAEEITTDRYKTFVQLWLTTTAWQQSHFVTKYYILVTNALISMVEKLEDKEDMFSASSIMPIHKFAFVAKFCHNIVMLSNLTDSTEMVFGRGADQLGKREEDAIAEIFCYEALRTFGDRILRPSARTEFCKKLSDICRREFLCNKSYTPQYIESLILGNYHTRTGAAHVAYSNVQDPEDQMHAIMTINKKCKS